MCTYAALKTYFENNKFLRRNGGYALSHPGAWSAEKFSASRLQASIGPKINKIFEISENPPGPKIYLDFSVHRLRGAVHYIYLSPNGLGFFLGGE